MLLTSLMLCHPTPFRLCFQWHHSLSQLYSSILLTNTPFHQDWHLSNFYDWPFLKLSLLALSLITVAHYTLSWLSLCCYYPTWTLLVLPLISLPQFHNHISTLLLLSLPFPIPNFPHFQLKMLSWIGIKKKLWSCLFLSRDSIGLSGAFSPVLSKKEVNLSNICAMGHCIWYTVKNG